MKNIFLTSCVLITLANAQLSKIDAQLAIDTAWQKHLTTLRTERADEMKNKAITIENRTMRFLEKTFGEAPKDGRPLVISMHGGGSAPPQVNDQQWQNQIMLYEPEGSLYIAPRAPTDTWNLWHEGHIDALFDRLIANCIAIHNINPQRVYLMGYSAGGDGVYQLAPRMADRFAAASMMAGHPNETQPDSLRNLPFAILVGGKDAAYDRNTIAKSWAEKLDLLEKNHPNSYIHFFRSYEECGHWMNRKDAEAVPWMLKHTRNPWPKNITWLQDDVLSSRFYWLSVDTAQAKAGKRIEAKCHEQTISIESKDTKELTLRLADDLLDLDQEITVKWNGKEVHKGKVPRTQAAIVQSLKERSDSFTIATALLKVKAPD